MKNISNTIKSLFLGILLFSCEDYLEPEPQSFISADRFYNTDAELENGILNVYDGIQGINDPQFNDPKAVQIEFILTEMRTDNTETRSGGFGDQVEFEDYNIATTNGIVYNYYISMYGVLHRIHTVFASLDNATEARKGALEGELKFLRAYTYFNLVRLFGDVPMPTSVTLPTDDEILYTRVEKSVIYDLIEEDLLFAIDNLDNTYKSRASQAAAQALLAKVYLTLAGAEGVNAAANYTAAAGLCEDVMAAGFSLMPDFLDIFYVEKNSEIIFAIDYIENNVNTSQNFGAEFYAQGNTSGLNYVTQNIRSAFIAAGETDRATFVPEAADPNNAHVTKYDPSGLSGHPDIPTVSPTALLGGNDWVVLRYADVLLMHAEAILAGANSTTDVAAVNSYKEVRGRAGFDVSSVTTFTKQELLDERRFELAFENHRFFDLIRFDQAIPVLSAHSTANGGDFTSTDLLLPIPQTERDLSNGLLSQNSGY